MNNVLKKVLVPVVATTFALALPLTIEIETTSAGASPVVRVNDACGQATECTRSSNKICSTHNGDYEGYACSKGCEAL